MNKLSFLRIVFDHFNTLRDYSTGKFDFTNIIILYGAPAFIVFVLYFFLPITVPAYHGIVVSIFSIFAALLLNLQVILLGFFDLRSNGLDVSTGNGDASVGDGNAEGLGSISAKVETKSFNLKALLVDQTSKNVSYLILISIFILIVSFVFYLIEFNEKNIDVVILSYLFFHFCFVLFMVLRVHMVFTREAASAIK